MQKSEPQEKISAPAIVGKAKEDRKPYLFKNKKNPGQAVNCFMGDCPKDNEWFKDTVTQHNLVDGQVVHLTEKEARHLNDRGTEKPITSVGPDGRKVATGQTYIDSRFELHQC